MNYTKNYHLPQWVKEDRIMMADFNQMCADIESGLTETAQGSAEAKQGASALEQKTLRRLQRLAYNHYCAVQDTNSSLQVGVFHQNPAKNGSGVTGTALWNGVCFAARNPTDEMPGSLGNYIQEVSPMTLVKNDLAACTTLKVNISVPMSAYLNKIDLCGSVIDNVPNTPFSAQLTLVNLDTGEPEASHRLNISSSLTTGAMVNSFYDCFLTFHAGQHYQLQLQPLAAVFSGSLHLTYNDASAPLLPVANNRSITAAHTMREHEESSGGLLIVRGIVHGGTLTVKWDGQTVPLQTSRMVRLTDGRMVREMVYFRNDTIPAETSFTLRYDLNGTSSFLFYDWGAVLL